jgi:hypothetical protein
MTFLIKKPSRPGDIVTFKLETAEEVIAKLVEETDKVYKLERPMTLSYTPQGVGLTPWIITSEPEAVIEIDKHRVMAQTPTMKNASDQYLQGTTGIKLA